jgi:hypothetical protein
VGKNGLAHRLEHAGEKPLYLLLAVIAAAEKNHARSRRAGERQQLREVSVGRDHDALFADSPLEQCTIRRGGETSREGMNGIGVRGQ